MNGWWNVVEWWLLAVFLLALGRTLVSTPRVKGWWGDRLVRQHLRRHLQAPHYHCLHDITLPLKDGGSTQVDHIVIATTGVFVMETKHLRGWIFGSEHQRYWKQRLYRHSQPFPNPLLQNKWHIKALQELLNLPAAQLHSVVVFTATCEFRTPLPAHVLPLAQCAPYILQFQEPVMTPQHMQQIIQRLEALRLPPNRQTHQAHVEHLRQRHNGKVLAARSRTATHQKMSKKS